MKNSIEAIIVRGISILSKFIIIFFLAKNISVDDFGGFQLVSYFVLISTTLFGVEYYNISNREVVISSEKKQVYLSHINFIITVFPVLLLISIVLLIILFPRDIISPLNLLLVYCVCIGDYFSQEVYRYLIVNKEFRKANLQLIYKSTFFLILILICACFTDELNFIIVIKAMALSYLILFFIAFQVFRKVIFDFTEIKVKFLNRKLIKRKFKKLAPFILLALCVKGIEFSDKFLIGNLLGMEEVGIYSFMYSIAAVVNVFIVSGFYLIFLPILIEKYNKDKIGFKSELFKFAKLNIIFSIFIIAGIFLFKDVLFALLNKEEYVSYSEILSYTLLGMFLKNLSLIPSIYLYVSHRENVILKITFIAFLLGFGATFFLLDTYGLKGAAFGFILSYFLMFILKLFYHLYYERR